MSNQKILLCAGFFLGVFTPSLILAQVLSTKISDAVDYQLTKFQQTGEYEIVPVVDVAGVRTRTDIIDYPLTQGRNPQRAKTYVVVEETDTTIRAISPKDEFNVLLTEKPVYPVFVSAKISK